MRIAPPIVVLGMIGALAVPGAVSAQSLLVVGDTEDAAAVERLVASLDEPAGRLLAPPRPADTLRDRVCREHDVAYVIALDGRGGAVHVVRCADATLLSRRVDPTVVRDAPYAMAVAAAELLELARDAPLAQAPAVVAAARVSAPGAVATAARADAEAMRVGLALGFGAVVAAGIDGTTAWVAPRVGLDVLLRPGAARTWFAVGVRIAPLGTRTYSVPNVELVEVTFWRHDASLRLAIGHATGAATIIGAFEAGAALVDVTARRDAGSELGSDRRFRGQVGLVGELRYRVVPGLSVALDVGVSWSPGGARYRFGDAPIVEDAAITARSGLGVVWDI